jgi:hypothetical protein
VKSARISNALQKTVFFFFEWARQLATEFVIITLLIPLLPDKIAADVGDK